MSAPPPVQHAANCLCGKCISERQAEMRRRLEEARREDARGRELAFLESLGGPVFSRLGMPKKAQPGTTRAIARRYGRSA